MTVPESSLPAHDAFSAPTRAFELASIVAAAALLVVHVVIVSAAPQALSWWTVPVIGAGMLSADFLSGIVHWGADTWGSETMPVLGRRLLRPFRVHHVNPEDFLRRHWIDTNGDVAFLVTVVLVAVLFVPVSSAPSAATRVFLVALCAVGLPTNQVHQWAHQTNPPRVIAWLQQRGLLLNRTDHARHHEPPYVTNYCIATGWCNGALVACNFFSRMERIVQRVTGLTPRHDEIRFLADIAEQPHSPTTD
jgi:ubiquitin-conjugating enzyme E2 variant